MVFGIKSCITLNSATDWLLLFSRLVMSHSLPPHGMQHARPPCPSPFPRACSNSSPLTQWFHPTISSSVVPFSCFHSFPASGSFLRSPFFTSDGQSIGVSASTSGRISFRTDWLNLLVVQWTLKSLLQYHSSIASLFRCLAFFMVQLSQPYVTTGKTIALIRWTLSVK